MDLQIVDPDPGLNCNAALVATGDLHFEIDNMARFQIIMLDDTVLLLRNLVQF